MEIYVFFASKQLSAVTYSGNLRWALFPSCSCMCRQSKHNLVRKMMSICVSVNICHRYSYSELDLGPLISRKLRYDRSNGSQRPGVWIVHKILELIRFLKESVTFTLSKIRISFKYLTKWFSVYRGTKRQTFWQTSNVVMFGLRKNHYSPIFDSKVLSEKY